jgi:pimeloyl-ACP methyl ester carboxylesterase
MRFAKTSHGKIFYTVKGEGMPVVLIRGLGRWSAHWCGWDEALAKHCKVITFDNKGLGLTTSPMRPWHTLSDIANDVAVVLRQERIDSAHIIGTSLGGMVSLVFALRHPELTKSISVIAASVGRSGHPRISARAARILIRAPLLRDGIYDELAGLLTSPKTSQEVRQKLAREWRQEDAKHKQPIVTVISQLIAVLRFRKWEDLAKIKSAAQIIVGKDDLFVPRGNSLFLHSQMPTSQLIELEGAGHEPHVDQPEAMTKLIVNFIKHHNHPPSH